MRNQASTLAGLASEIAHLRTALEAIALFDYIDGWYSPTRIQKRLGWRSPDEYEAAWYQDQQAGTGPI